MSEKTKEEIFRHAMEQNVTDIEKLISDVYRFVPKEDQQILVRLRGRTHSALHDGCIPVEEYDIPRMKS